MTTAAVIIPFRDRGIDPLRRQNLEYTTGWWQRSPWPVYIVDDGGTGKDMFNRSRAYNRGAAICGADVLCYIESDTVLPYDQLQDAINEAQALPGLVVPFSHQFKLSEADSVKVRAGADPDEFEPEQTNDTHRTTVNHGSAGVISRATLEAVGQWDEAFEGHGHDDTAMMIGFEKTCRPVRFIGGVAWHLYHLDMDPGLTRGAHITKADCAAQDRNRARLKMYAEAPDTAAIRRLTAGAATDWRMAWR